MDDLGWHRLDDSHKWPKHLEVWGHDPPHCKTCQSLASERTGRLSLNPQTGLCWVRPPRIRLYVEIANQYSKGVCFQIKVVLVFLLRTLTGIQRCQRFPCGRSQFELGWRRSLKHGEKRGPKYSSFGQYRNQHRRPISAKEEENVISSQHSSKMGFDSNNNTFMWFPFYYIFFLLCSVKLKKKNVAILHTKCWITCPHNTTKLRCKYTNYSPFPQPFQRFLQLKTMEALVCKANTVRNVLRLRKTVLTYLCWLLSVRLLISWERFVM